MPSGRRRSRSTWLGKWSLALVGAVLAINLFGVWEIAVVLGSLSEQRRKTLVLATEGRARAIEGQLATVTADLAFLVVAAPMRHTGPIDDERWRHDAGAALLLFLRGHPIISSLTIRDADETLLEAGRPRGVPGYWFPGGTHAPMDPPPRVPSRSFPVAPPRPEVPVRTLVAVLEPLELLVKTNEATVEQCALHDADGAHLAGTLPSTPEPRLATTEVAVGRWGDATPWQLTCVTEDPWRSAGLEPLVVRQRALVLVNVTVMLLAAVLGGFAFREMSRRRQLEADVAEEFRVRELERQLFHAERLGTAGRLAAGIAHEINNPLEGMANYLGLARDCLASGDSDRATRYVEGAGAGLEQVAGIVRRVLDHADPSMVLDGVADVAGVIAQSLEFVQARQEFSDIVFELDVPAEGARVRGSGVMLGQVFLNLVLNACEAQPDGGQVRVSCKLEGPYVSCEVADRGPGVPHLRRGRIFEPFESTKQSAGLGLSICHSIVGRHDGELTVHDREGGGSVFRVRLRSAEQENDPDV